MALQDTLRLIFFIIVLTSIKQSFIAGNSTNHDPIVINTVAQHYENPTLDQYNECTRSRDRCINGCNYDKTCEKQCQICPILIDQDILVQGINDTLYKLPISTSRVNQTNIIRLTNEIRNIIRTSLGNITAHNQNNITIYQKTSKAGGKFGLGYTERGPCCLIIEPQRCRGSLNGPVCTHRRQQTCGSHCISRVMRSKRVVTCSETEPENCTQSIEYLPQHTRPGCQYTSKWPFIVCNTGLRMQAQHSGSRKRTTCARCFEMPYSNIIRGQVPRACLPCFDRASFRKPSYPHQQSYYSGYGQNPIILSDPRYQPYQSYQFNPPPLPLPSIYGNYLESNDISALDADFKVDEQKCINEDGTAVENCTDDDNPFRLNIETDPSDADGYGNESLFHENDYDASEEEITSRNIVHRRRRRD